MIIVKRINQYNENNIFFCEPIKNNIMNDGNFIRIMYSDNIFTLNGIYLLLNLNIVICEKYFNKFKCTFNINSDKDVIDNIKTIEEQILKKYNISNKIPQYKIYDQLKNGNIKLFNDIENKTNGTFILKIAGIWETSNNYGLTYKFIKANSLS
jgi:Zn-dependent M16 (insulinase) family peptidase